MYARINCHSIILFFFFVTHDHNFDDPSLSHNSTQIPSSFSLFGNTLLLIHKVTSILYLVLLIILEGLSLSTFLLPYSAQKHLTSLSATREGSETLSIKRLHRIHLPSLFLGETSQTLEGSLCWDPWNIKPQSEDPHLHNGLDQAHKWDIANRRERMILVQTLSSCWEYRKERVHQSGVKSLNHKCKICCDIDSGHDQSFVSKSRWDAKVQIKICTRFWSCAQIKGAECQPVMEGVEAQNRWIGVKRNETFNLCAKRRIMRIAQHIHRKCISWLGMTWFEFFWSFVDCPCLCYCAVKADWQEDFIISVDMSSENTWSTSWHSPSEHCIHSSKVQSTDDTFHSIAIVIQPHNA